jgi:hypothetical protein
MDFILERFGDDVGDVGGRDDGGHDANNNASKGDGRGAGREGGGAPGRGSSGDGGGGSCLLQGLLLFIVKIFLCGIFIMCGGNR